MELTDEQIKQALEFCANCECNDEKTEKECALINMSFCKNYLRKQSLDYINRLEAENSRLQAQIEALQMDNNQLQSDIICANQNYEHMKELWNAEKERRKRVTDNLKAVLTERADHTEAINEFAERFLKKVHDNHYLLSDRNNSKGYGMFTVGIEQAVNETKKEMAGDSDE